MVGVVVQWGSHTSKVTQSVSGGYSSHRQQFEKQNQADTRAGCPHIHTNTASQVGGSQATPHTYLHATCSKLTYTTSNRPPALPSSLHTQILLAADPAAPDEEGKTVVRQTNQQPAAHPA